MAVPLDAAVLAIFLPVVIAALSHLIAKVPKGGAKLAKAICILASYITLFLVSSLIFEAQHVPIRAQLLTISLPIGVTNFGLYVDFLALVPAFLSSLFTALALTYNVYYLSPYNRAYKAGWEFNRSYSFILLFNGAMLGTLFSSSLLSLIIFWELISVCSYVLISFWNENQFSLLAAIKCFIMTHVGSLALLMTAIVIYFSTGTLEISEVGQMIPLGDTVIFVIFPLLLIAALPKTALFPLHTWLPDGTVAPTSTIVFHVCGFQSGIYMIIRFFSDVFHMHVISATKMTLPLLFGNVSVWSFAISLIGAITLIIGALNGLVENDFKRIVAYGTISGLGCIIMAAGLTTPLCIEASLFLMISHALCFGLLFLCAGSVIYATGRHDINEMGGLYRHMPITAICCLIGILTLSTVPLLSEFASKYLLLHATINAQAIFFAVIAFLGCALNVAIAIRLLHSVFMQKSSKSSFNFPVKDPPISMLAPMVLMSAFLIVFGIAPAIPLSSFVIPAVKDIGFSVNTVTQSWLIETPLGFWNPTAVAASILCLSALLLCGILYFERRAIIYRKTASEEMFKPFLCGEDSDQLDNPFGYHFYHALTRVLRVEKVCHALDVDRAYNLLAKKFVDFTDKLRRLDMPQGYLIDVSFALAGAIVITLVAVLGG